MFQKRLQRGQIAGSKGRAVRMAFSSLGYLVVATVESDGSGGKKYYLNLLADPATAGK